MLGHEPTAQHTIDYVSPQMRLNATTGYGPETYETSKSVNGRVLQVTYSNLKKSYYTDNDGNVHHISKIVFSFSDLNHNALGKDGKTYLCLHNDPANGFSYNGSNGVTLTETFYDENGNLVNIASGSGYLAATSLNAAYGNPAAFTVTKTGTPIHVESVSVLNGGRAVGLQGSGIVASGNTLKAPATIDYANSGKNIVYNLGHGKAVNSPQSTASTWQGDDWDNNPNETYWATGLVSLSGSSVTLRFSVDTLVQDETVYVTTQTIIPSTPGPKKPAPVSVHYHYDVTTNRQKTRRCKLYSILRKYDDKLLKSVNK